MMLMRNSVCTRCGTAFLHAVDEVEVCPACENKVLRAEIERQRNVLRRVLDTPARRVVIETGTLRDWLPTRMREEADWAAGGR